MSEARSASTAPSPASALSPAVRATAIGAAGLLGAVLAVLIAWWVMMPSRGVLYANLAPRDLLQVTQRLGALGIAHDIAAETGTVRVARDRVETARLALAADGIPDPSGAGYATRDAASFRISAGTQTQREALEADLARTLVSLGGVHGARVHLSVDGRAASATVVLDTLGARPQGDVLITIRRLVAGAMAGLAPESVSVVDSKGRPFAAAENDGLAPADLRRKALETDLAARAMALVGGVVGAENARVEITADVAFASRTVTQNRLDPAGQVLTSNETTATPQGEITGERATYDVTRTTETERVEEGRIDRLSVAVLVNEAALAGRTDPQALLSRIEGLVADGIGLDTARGDSITVESLPFAQAARQIPEAAMTTSGGFNWLRLAEIVGVAIVLLAALGFAFRALRLASPRDRAGAHGGAAAATQPQAQAPSAPAPAPAEGARHLAYEQGTAADLGHDVGRLVQEHPDRAVALVRNWLNDRGTP